jgi:cobalt-zinc-cadmium efflux system outer membrane protein
MNTKLCALLVVTLVATACTPRTAVRSDPREPVARALASAVAQPVTLAAADDAYAALPDTVLDADAAVAFGLRNDPRVRMELARLDIAQAERIQAGLVSNPMLSLMALRPSGGGRFELDYSLMQSLYELFARSRRVAAADARQRQVEADVLARLLDFGRATELAYYRAVTAQALLDIERRDLALEQQALALYEAQAGSGSATVQAVISQRAVVSMQAHEVEAAQAAVSDTRSALALALGLPSSRALILPSSLPVSALPQLDQQALTALAIAKSPDLAAARLERAAIGAESSLESKTALRTIEPSLGVAATRESDGMRLEGLAVQLRLPLFDHGQGRSALAASKLQQAQAGLDAAERQLPLEVERALAALLAADRAAGHSSHHRREQATLESLAARTYAAGGGSYEDWVQARRNGLGSERDQARARLAASEAGIELRRVTASAALLP